MNEIIHAPLRLRICAALSEGAELEFSAIRDLLGVSDSVTSKHLKVLVDAGYVELRKVVTRRGRLTWVRLTREGSTEFDAYVAELRSLLGEG